MTSVAEPAAQSTHKRRVNELIQESLDEAWTEPIAFFCECPSSRCFETVWLTSSQYAESRADVPVRVPGH
jgi:hypothetical protein